MITFCIAVVVLCVFLFIANEYFHSYRNNKVYALRVKILHAYEFSVYASLPSYSRMMYSFEPLTEEYWVKKVSK